MLLVTAMSLGAPLGVGIYVFWYGHGHSYLTDSPRACVNCHVMEPQYKSWTRSSHRGAASCNSCHAPGNLAQKLKAKAVNGLLHSYAFTTGRFAEPIRIKPRNREGVQRACLSCHGEIFAKGSRIRHDPESSCLRCHADVGHH
jgi:cytochrome c nitrite reductase small subunit